VEKWRRLNPPIRRCRGEQSRHRRLGWPDHGPDRGKLCRDVRHECSRRNPEHEARSARHARTNISSTYGHEGGPEHEARSARHARTNISSTYGHEGAAGASVYVGSKHAVEGSKVGGARDRQVGKQQSAATRDKVWPCREPSHPLGPTIAKMAPCGSRPWAIQLPPGTCMGPWMIWPPASFTRAIAASTASTLK